MRVMQKQGWCQWMPTTEPSFNHQPTTVYAHDRFIMASNDAYDRLWRSSAELFEDACRRKTIPHLLLAS